jgi:glycosyltransferase involved in cell wall biosynthesis
VRLLIAIPVYNERKYVRQVLERVRQFHDDILVVDDGSTDGTCKILGEVACGTRIHTIRHATNSGYGQSLIDAFAYADCHRCDWVVTMDCDEQHEPEMIPEFIRQIRTDQWDLISGSRYMAPRKDDDLPPGDRRAINETITSLINGLFGWELTDAFCGFKAHRVSAMRKLRLTETGYAFPMQLWPQVCEHRLRLTEIPVRLIYNDPTRHFGGQLDDAGVRLRHYVEVLNGELRRMNRAEVQLPEAVGASAGVAAAGSNGKAAGQPAVCCPSGAVCG